MSGGILEDGRLSITNAVPRGPAIFCGTMRAATSVPLPMPIVTIRIGLSGYDWPHDGAASTSAATNIPVRWVAIYIGMLLAESISNNAACGSLCLHSRAAVGEPGLY